MNAIDLYVQNPELVWHTFSHCWIVEEDEELRRHSLDVAVEFSKRALENLLLIKFELDRIGYEFLNPNSVLLLAQPTAETELELFEHANGTLPVVLKAWYSVFHSIDFRQSPEQLAGNKQHTDSPASGLGFNCPLLFSPFSQCVKNVTDSFTPHTIGIKFLPTGGFASNCDSKGVSFPTRSFENVYYDDGGGSVLFGSAIRFYLRSGGFPYWWIAYQKGMEKISTLHGLPDFGLYWNRITTKLIKL